MDHVLLALHAPVFQVACHLGHRQVVAVGVVKHHNAFHARAVHQQAEVVFRANNGGGGVVLADGPANHDACLAVDAGQHRIQYVAAHVVKVNVHALGAMGFEALAHGAGAGLVVDAGVKAQFLNHPVALGLAPGDAHHAATPNFGHLPHRLAHGTGCA